MSVFMTSNAPPPTTESATTITSTTKAATASSTTTTATTTKQLAAGGKNIMFTLEVSGMRTPPPCRTVRMTPLNEAWIWAMTQVVD